MGVYEQKNFKCPVTSATKKGVATTLAYLCGFDLDNTSVLRRFNRTYTRNFQDTSCCVVCPSDKIDAMDSSLDSFEPPVIVLRKGLSDDLLIVYDTKKVSERVFEGLEEAVLDMPKEVLDFIRK